jgi:hypothetical protein
MSIMLLLASVRLFVMPKNLYVNHAPSMIAANITCVKNDVNKLLILYTNNFFCNINNFVNNIYELSTLLFKKNQQTKSFIL